MASSSIKISRRHLTADDASRLNILRHLKRTGQIRVKEYKIFEKRLVSKLAKQIAKKLRKDI